MSETHLRFGIIGTNFISDWFCWAARESGVAEPVAVFSRSEESGERFAAEHGLAEVHLSLESMLASASVDAVYVASPISAHHEQVLASLAAGRPVLCEKTLGADAEQEREIFHAAEQAGLVVMEAVRSLYDEAFDIVREQLPKVGAIRAVHFDKQQYSSRYDKVKAGEQLNAFNPALGNSAVGDIGVYVIAPAVDLFGTPSSAHGCGVRLANGFEAAGTLVMQYPDTVVSCTWSKISRSVAPSTIHGERGSMTIDSISGPGQITIEWPSGETEIILDRPPQADRDNMPAEVRRFVELVRSGQGDPRREEVSVTTRALMDEYLTSLD